VDYFDRFLKEAGMEAWLVLEDGRTFRGKAFGALRESAGEVVFHTAMTGYQEILTDPSYAGQIVVMTYPLIGNYGVGPEDAESRTIWPQGFVVREYSDLFSNWRGRLDLPHYLKEHGVAGITGVDTRALTRHIRSRGAMRGIVSTRDEGERLLQEVRRSPAMIGRNLVGEVTTPTPYPWREPTPSPFEVDEGPAEPAPPAPISPGQRIAGREGSREPVPREEPPLPAGPLRVAVLDYGVKYNILRRLVDVGGEVTVYPAATQADDLLAAGCDGVVLSNGPGDPAALVEIVEQARRLAERVPLFGICLGHQIIGQAFGYATYKLTFGHHGANHPVRRLQTGRVEITSQNHGFAVDLESGGRGLIETHRNLNDGTNEGFRHAELPVFAVQYHPEASPGPRDASYLFRAFVRAMGAFRDRRRDAGSQG
jgi:carbamoyl-phosphate synthase small subunit